MSVLYSKGQEEETLCSMQNGRSPLRIVIAGGGTGGHLFPGIAIAQEFMSRNPENSVIYVGTGRPLEVSILSQTGFKHKRISVEGIKGRGLWNQTISICKIPKGVIQSVFILKRFKPNLVVCVGSYAAGPLGLAAWLLGIKIVIHEQNIMLGITNRILLHFADRIYVSFKDTSAGLNPEKVRFTGNPVRKEILECARSLEMPDINASGSKRPFTVLILGGSQGAHSINMKLMEAIEHIKKKDDFFFVHQTGAQDETIVKNAYKRHAISCDVRAFFVDMARQYQKADLIICRSGATTVAEITTIGKGVIAVPFPFAADNHQVLNARALERAGAAELIPDKGLNGKALAERINYYFSNPKVLHRMASRAKRLGRPDAAALVVDDCYKLITQNL